MPAGGLRGVVVGDEPPDEGQFRVGDGLPGGEPVIDGAFMRVRLLAEPFAAVLMAFEPVFDFVDHAGNMQRFGLISNFLHLIMQNALTIAFCRAESMHMSPPYLSLPPIALEDLPESTKDFLLALCNQEDIAPEEAMRRTLDLAAARAGFAPKPDHQEAA